MNNADMNVLRMLFESIRENIVADLVDSPRLILSGYEGTVIPVSEVVNIITARLTVCEEALKGGEDK